MNDNGKACEPPKYKMYDDICHLKKYSNTYGPTFKVYIF